MSSVVLVLGIIPSIRSSARLVSGLPGTLPRFAIRQHDTQHQTREAKGGFNNRRRLRQNGRPEQRALAIATILPNVQAFPL
jgi:predicted Rdx family selenoprotein